MNECIETQGLFESAQTIIEEYLAYGEVLQVDEDHEYGPHSAIGMLKTAVNKYRQKYE